MFFVKLCWRLCCAPLCRLLALRPAQLAARNLDWQKWSEIPSLVQILHQSLCSVVSSPGP
jgi:hypothetical protein